jgi:hypothetical protein
MNARILFPYGNEVSPFTALNLTFPRPTKGKLKRKLVMSACRRQMAIMVTRGYFPLGSQLVKQHACGVWAGFGGVYKHH